MLIAGDHVPDIPLVLVVGNGGMLSPEQKGPTGLNVGVVSALIVIFVDACSEHPTPSVTVTVYVVEVLGNAVGFAIFGLFSPVFGDHEYVYPLLPFPVGEPPITTDVPEHIDMLEPASATIGLVIVKFKQPAGARFPHKSSTKPLPLTKHNEYVPEILKAGEMVALKLFS